MIQQIIAIIILIFFILKLWKEWKKKAISINEFIFWLAFWSLGILAIILIKPIDKIVMSLGFSSSGINLVFYLAVLMLFYLIFRMRLRIVKIEKDITELSRKISLK
jgi:small membrane protein